MPAPLGTFRQFSGSDPAARSCAAQLGKSDRETAAKALRPLWLQMSKRRLLTDDGADENLQAMEDSAETLVEHLHRARTGLPDDSPVDPLLEELQDACNRFRTDVHNRGWQGYRIFLRDLREAAQRLVFKVNEVVPLRAGERLAAKIDPTSAEIGQMTYSPNPDGSGSPNRR
jgi:hypothetical protein